MTSKRYNARTMELPRPVEVSCPYEAVYHTDVVVIGCGFAGLNAAVSAKETGQSVLVVDKGRPGYSGLSPWPSSFRWFDPDRDDADAFRAAIMRGGDYISNFHWYDNWIKESKKIYQRLSSWGILAQYPKASETGDFYETENFYGYREMYDRFDRHKKWIEVLKNYEIPFIEHTMVADILVVDNRAAGVIGFHVPSGQIIRVEAKAVVMATGNGSYKPTGYPTGGDTFDGEYMAYQLGLPITGKEFEDFHCTSTVAPGNVFLDNHWQYLENIWLCGGDVTKENSSRYADNKGNIMSMGRVRKAVYGMPVSDGSEIQDVSMANFTRRGASKDYETDAAEVRSGKMSTPVVASLVPGGAVGMCSHLAAGVFTGAKEDEGATEIKGLYVAGDGTHATSPAGAAYPCGVGFTSCFCSIDGDHAGRAAALFAAKEEKVMLPETLIRLREEEIKAPMQVEKGYDPNWARDVLHSIMAPYWVSVAKSEETLNAALVQVLYMKEHVVPKLAAANSHDLRLCLEVKHKVLSAEMKLRASLERQESRGNTYRTDFPYRDDEQFLCYIIIRKGDDGNMSLYREAVPEEWTGDKTMAYEKRYGYYFPGEAAAKGFREPERRGGKS